MAGNPATTDVTAAALTKDLRLKGGETGCLFMAI